jgi:hypothetical protein
MKRATPAPERVSARVEAIVGAAVAREEPLRQPPVRSTFAPHPNGVWANGRTAARPPQPWPPKPARVEQADDRNRIHLPRIEEETALTEPITETIAPSGFDEFILPDPPHAGVLEDESVPSAAEEHLPAAVGDDYTWASDVGPAIPAVPDPVLQYEPEVIDVLPPLVGLPGARDLDDLEELVHQLMRRVADLEDKLAQSRRSRWRRLLDLLMMYDPA